MEMTFQQYIDNPMGKRNAVFSQRDIFKNLYTEKFDKIFLREAGKIDYTLYVDKKTDRYIIHIKIPSETVKDFYYDAVIMFYTNDAVKRTSPSLQDYNVKFFSNDPAFVFTYLHVFLKHDLLIEDLKPKSPKLALQKFPKEKNPYGVPGYSKILYFAFIFMKSKNLFVKNIYTTNGVQYTPKKLLSQVEHADKKIADRQELGANQVKEENKTERVDIDRGSVNTTTRQPRGTFSKNVKTTKTTHRTSSSVGVKRTPMVKKTKRG